MENSLICHSFGEDPCTILMRASNSIAVAETTFKSKERENIVQQVFTPEEVFWKKINIFYNNLYIYIYIYK